MSFLLFNLVLIFIIIFLLVVLSMVWPPDSPWAPWWRTNRKKAREICKLAEITKSDLVYDLGCGDGTFLITAAKEFDAKGIGIEIDPLRVWIAKVRVWFNNLLNKVEIRQGDFFKTDLSKATVVVVYLVPKALEKLLPKFKKELKKGTKVISLKYEMGLDLERKDLRNNILLYKI